MKENLINLINDNVIVLRRLLKHSRALHKILSEVSLDPSIAKDLDRIVTEIDKDISKLIDKIENLINNLDEKSK